MELDKGEKCISMMSLLVEKKTVNRVKCTIVVYSDTFALF